LPQTDGFTMQVPPVVLATHRPGVDRSQIMPLPQAGPLSVQGCESPPSR
jgi:hypothetical protein